MERASRYPIKCLGYTWVDKKLAKYEQSEGTSKIPKSMEFKTNGLPAEMPGERAAELLQFRYNLLYQKESTATFIQGKSNIDTIQFQAHPLPTIQSPVTCPREHTDELPAYYAVAKRLFKEMIEGDETRKSPWGIRTQFELENQQQIAFLMNRTNHLFLGSCAPHRLTIDRSLPLRDIAMTLLRLLYDLAPEKESYISLAIPPTLPTRRAVSEESIGKDSLECALRTEFPTLWKSSRDSDDPTFCTLHITLQNSSKGDSTLQVPAHYAAAARKALCALATSSSPYRVPKKLSGRLLILSIISILQKKEAGLTVTYDPIDHLVIPHRERPKHSLPSEPPPPDWLIRKREERKAYKAERKRLEKKEESSEAPITFKEELIIPLIQTTSSTPRENEENSKHKFATSLQPPRRSTLVVGDEIAISPAPQRKGNLGKPFVLPPPKSSSSPLLNKSLAAEELN